jgi:ketosteroid isomerase-like protein
MKDTIQAKTLQFESFARDWLAAWNSHSIDAIMSHYAEGVTVKSPFLAEAVKGSGGTVTGRETLRPIYAKALQKYPKLWFEVIQVLASTESLVIHYKSVEGLYAAETFLLDEDGKAKLVLCHYATA